MHFLRRNTALRCARAIIPCSLTLLVLSSAILFAQTAPSIAPSATGSTVVVEGIVKNQTTGQPIADVRVALAPETSGIAAKTAVSDTDGRFTIRDVMPGRYNIAAQRTLFFRPPRNSGTTVLTVMAGQQYKDLEVLLLPTAVISGRITDENRQPLRSVRLDALRTGYREGHMVWTPAAQATSDDRGEYRLFNLSPGTYYVRATRSTGIAQMGQIYYPGVLEPRDAVAVRLQAGMEMGAVDLQLRAINRYAVQLTLGSVPPNSAVSFNLQRRASPIVDLQAPRFQTLPGNTYRLAEISPGSYDIVAQTATAPAPNQPRMIVASARIPVNVTDADVDLGTIRLTPSVPVTGRLVPAETLTAGIEASRLVLSLRPSELPMTFINSIRGVPDASGFVGIKADGSVQFPAVAPGRYQVAITGLPADTYLVAAREMGRDILDTGYAVTGNQGALEVVIGGSASVASVEGVVVNARGDAVPFGTVALVPALERRTNPAAFRNTTADQHGQFSMRAVLPGDYTIFAWEEVETGAWQNAEFLKTIENRGRPVRVQGGGQTAINVRIIPAP